VGTTETGGVVTIPYIQLIAIGGHSGGFERVITKIVCKLLLTKGGIMPGRLAFQDDVYFKGNQCWGCGNENPDGLNIKSYWDGNESVVHGSQRTSIPQVGPMFFIF